MGQENLCWTWLASFSLSSFLVVPLFLSTYLVIKVQVVLFFLWMYIFSPPSFFLFCLIIFVLELWSCTTHESDSQPLSRKVSGMQLSHISPKGKSRFDFCSHSKEKKKALWDAGARKKPMTKGKSTVNSANRNLTQCNWEILQCRHKGRDVVQAPRNVLFCAGNPTYKPSLRETQQIILTKPLMEILWLCSTTSFVGQLVF